MKRILLLFAICMGQLATAQSGIGTVTPQQSAVLDLVSADKVSCFHG